MGKHEAPAPAKKRSSGSPKHAAAPIEREAFRLKMPNWKLPKLPDLSDISFPKFSKGKRFADNETDEFYLEDNDTDYTEAPDADHAAPEVDHSANDFAAKKELTDDEVRSGVEDESIEPSEDAVLTEAGTSVEELTQEAENEADDETADELPGERKGFSLPKPDWTAVRAFFEKLCSYGMNNDAASHAHRRILAFSQNHVLMTAGAALLFFLVWLLPTRGWVRFLLYLVPFFFAGIYTLQDAVGEILDRVIPGRNLLISVAAVGLLVLSQPKAAVFVMLIYRIFLLLEAYLYEMRESRYDRLNELLPSVAVAETENGLERKRPDELKPGDILFVPAGEPVALDGIVIEGISTLDASALCGQGAAIDVGVNSRVFSGCRNVTNPLRVRVTNEFSDSTVSRCVRRVRRASESESSRTFAVDRILSYLPMALAILGLAVGVIASIATGSWRTWLYRGLLLIALGGCGDALLSARTAYFTGIFDAFKNGVSFLNDDIIDRFATTDMMIFSKTGSVTEGKYSVVAVYPVDYEEKDLLTIAALAECQSMHPIAVALRDACGIEIHHRSDITLLEETPGRGIHALFGGRNVYVGNSSLLLDHNIVFDVPSHKGTVIHVAVDNKYAGCIVLNDRVREGAFDAMEELRLRGVHATVMLTGDVRSMARPIASSLSFDMVKCELSNEAKLEALNYLRDSKGNSAAIGYVSSKDEDTDILQRADVGVGFAALSQYRLIAEAAVLITDSKIFQIPQALYLAKRISLAALLDMVIMLGLEALLIILGLLGAVSIWVALLLVLLARIGTLIYSIYFK